MIGKTDNGGFTYRFIFEAMSFAFNFYIINILQNSPTWACGKKKFAANDIYFRIYKATNE